MTAATIESAVLAAVGDDVDDEEEETAPFIRNTTTTPTPMSPYHPANRSVRPSSITTTDDNNSNSQQWSPSSKSIALFLGGALGLDIVLSLFLLVPWCTAIQHAEEGGATTSVWWTHHSLTDLAILAGLRWMACLGVLVYTYAVPESIKEDFYYIENKHHPNGEAKSRDELEEEALELPWKTWVQLYMERPSCSVEVLCGMTQLMAVIKCLARLRYELLLASSQPAHAVFWLAILLSTGFSLVQAMYMEAISKTIAEWSQRALPEPAGPRRRLWHGIRRGLQEPLLQQEGADQETTAQSSGSNNIPRVPSMDDTNQSSATVRGVSDISSDCAYQADWTDLWSTCRPDWPLLAWAFVFLILAAICQTMIPKYLGQILDALTKAYVQNESSASGKSNGDPFVLTDDIAFATTSDGKTALLDVPGFTKYMRLLVLVSIFAGVFSGLRGAYISLPLSTAVILCTCLSLRLTHSP